MDCNYQGFQCYDSRGSWRREKVMKQDTESPSWMGWTNPDSQVHGAHLGHMNLGIWEGIYGFSQGPRGKILTDRGQRVRGWWGEDWLRVLKEGRGVGRGGTTEYLFDAEWGRIDPKRTEGGGFYSQNAQGCAKWQWNARDCVTGLHNRRSRECNPVTSVECVSLSFPTPPCILAFITYILWTDGIAMALVYWIWHNKVAYFSN